MTSIPIVEVRDLGRHTEETVTVKGWVERVRIHGKVAFVVVRDGTGLLQGVLVQKELSQDLWELGCSLTQDSCVSIGGEVREDARSPGGYEMGVVELSLIGASEDFPIQPKEHGVDFLLDYRHLWLRSSTQRAGLRMRSEVEKAIHDFFDERGFVRIDTPILTGAIGESAGTLFETDYFGERAFLAQTGQLYVEAACPAFRKVYCFGPTFRAEKSKTRRHLTEFWMLEPEVAFADSNDNMRLQEDLVTYLVARTLDRCAEQLDVLERDTSALENITSPFPRITYSEAVDIVREAGSETEWGDDLGGADETRIAEKFDKPVFVYNYPKAAKAFYMKEMRYCLKSTAHYMLWSWRFRLLSSVAAWTIPVRGWSWTSSSPTMRHAWSTWRVCAGRKGLCAWAVAGWERSGEHRGGVSSAHTVEGRPRCWREPCSTARARPCVCGFSLPGSSRARNTEPMLSGSSACSDWEATRQRGSGSTSSAGPWSDRIATS